MVVHSANGTDTKLFTGRVAPGFPSMGSWVLYGLGSESQSLPAYVVMPDPTGALEAGQPMYANGFLPAVYQPTMFRGGDRPVLNVGLPTGVTHQRRTRTLKLIREMNESTLDPADFEFSARVNAYDLAFKMQTEAPDILDISREPRETMDLYGIGREADQRLWPPLPAMRWLVENGVPFRLRRLGRRRGEQSVGRTLRH